MIIITSKIPPPILHAKMIYISCLVILDDLFSVSFRAETIVVERDGDDVRIHTGAKAEETDVAIIFNEGEDWEICFFVGFVDCVGR